MKLMCLKDRTQRLLLCSAVVELMCACCRFKVQPNV